MTEKYVQLFVSKRVVLCNSVNPAILLVSSGKIEKIISCSDNVEISEELKNYPGVECHDFGDYVLMPGIVDSHVHVNEPGRSHWEGFLTATKAAAAGGVTTIVDMPLNSIPPTTTVKNLKTKALAAQGNTFIDVGFWGGVIPGNQADLKTLVEAGVVGFKCFLCPSGVDEFPHVGEDDVKKALLELQNSKTVLAFHAEREVETVSKQTNAGDPCNYDTYLQSRPSLMEVEAIKMIVNWCQINNSRCHIVHLSASEALSLVKEAKTMKLPLTAETCYHYLYLTAEKVPRCATQFKCCPPIRDDSNREKLWSALKDGILDMVVSDHSPCTADLKGTDTGDFLSAWGGISSLQFGLSLLWTEARQRGLTFPEIVKLMCSEPARLCGYEGAKGALSPGMDADIVVWDPEETVEILESGIFHKNKLTPYIGEKLFGKVVATVVRGNFVYKEGKFSDKPLGKLLLKNEFLENLVEN